MAEPYSDSVAEATRALQRAQALLHDEISRYPTPVAGCDEQFTHLLAERRRVVDALEALKTRVFVPTPRQLFDDRKGDRR